MKSIESLLTHLNYKASLLGLIRIALWTMAFLTLAGLYLPEKSTNMPFSENVQGLPITPLVTLPSDPQFIKPKTELEKNLNIAWISDSSSVIYRPGAKFLDFSTMSENRLLPAQTVDALKQQGMTDLHMDLYIRLSLRSLEAYTLTQLALQNDADLIVLTLNPFFIFNNHSIFKGESHFARASQTWAHDYTVWHWLALFPSPSDHLWATLGSRFSIITDAPSLAENVQNTKAELWKAAFPLLKEQPDQKPPGGSAEGLKENAMIFWVTQRYLKGDLSKLVNDKNEAVNSKWYRQLIRLNDLDTNTFNHEILIRTLENIKASGKKALIYLAPVSENLHDDQTAWERYQDIKEKLNQFKKSYEDPKVAIIIDIPPEVLKGSVFVKDDDVHLNAAGKFPEFLAGHIASLVAPANDPSQKEHP